MSLNWNLKAVKDSDSFCFITAFADGDGYKRGDRIFNPLTKSLIFVTMSLDIGEITEKNYVEFFQRLRLYEDLFGQIIRFGGDQWDGPERTSLDDVRRHIGLTTNVTTKPLKTWLNRIIIDNYFRELTYKKSWDENRSAADKEPSLIDAISAYYDKMSQTIPA